MAEVNEEMEALAELGALAEARHFLQSAIARVDEAMEVIVTGGDDSAFDENLESANLDSREAVKRLDAFLDSGDGDDDDDADTGDSEAEEE